VLVTYFENIKILELASVLAGPLVGSFFSELGATVVKIENKRTNGDVTRSWRNKIESKEDLISSYYASANNDKKVILMDFNDVLDREELQKLISEADIVISNFQKRVSEKFSIDPYSIAKKFPHIIFCQLDAFSYEDPRPAYDMVMQAEAGYISMCGEPNHLAKIPVAMMDVLAAHQMKEALLIALLEKSRTHKGGIIFVSLFKSALTGLVNQATNYLNEGLIAEPIGTKHPNIAPYGDIVETADGRKLILAIGSNFQFKGLLRALDLLDVFPEYKNNSLRLSKRSQMMEQINQVTSQIGFEKMTTLLRSKGLPYGVINNIGTALSNKDAEEMIERNKYGKKSLRHLAFKIEML